MPDVDRYVHGTPSWVDLATPDPAAAKEFYGALFGWTFEENDTDQPGVTYTMASKRGRSVAGVMQLSEEMAASGMPPCWTSYVTVDDLEGTAAKVAPAGGQVLQPPMDVMEAGRMAVVADSTGAVLALWEPKEHIGAEVVNEHGALTWNELLSADVPTAAAFYAEVLGWTAETAPMPMGDYTVFRTPGGNESGIAGGMTPPMEMPSVWAVYFSVDDCAATVAAAEAAGATVLMPPTPVPEVGTMAALVDPQGAAFSILQPAAG